MTERVRDVCYVYLKVKEQKHSNKSKYGLDSNQ